MAPRRKLYSFWIDPEHLEGLRAVKERDGVLPSEQIRRALAEWLKRKGMVKGSASGKRGGRKRGA